MTTTDDRYPTFRPGWLKQQIDKSVESMDSLPPKIRASLQQPTARRRYREQADSTEAQP